MKEQHKKFLEQTARAYKIKNIYSFAMVRALRETAKPIDPEGIHCQVCFGLANDIEMKIGETAQ